MGTSVNTFEGGGQAIAKLSMLGEIYVTVDQKFVDMNAEVEMLVTKIGHLFFCHSGMASFKIGYVDIR
jgi:hypothetical protein